MTKFKEKGTVKLPDNKDIESPIIEWKSIALNNDQSVTIELYYYTGNHLNPTISRIYTKIMPDLLFSDVDSWLNSKIKEIHKTAKKI